MSNANWMVKGDTLRDYLEACKTADIKNFKRDPRLTKIFEHASIEQGAAYLSLILKQTPELFKHTFTNDLYGNPYLYEYILEYGYFSPSTLQYIGVLSNLVTKFGSLDGMRIVEVGGGYGGQCRTVLDVFKPVSYTIIDLYEVVELQKKYLDGLDVKLTSIIMKDYCYDLFISNYALSEIPNNDAYIDLARRCKHGYITCNTDMVKLDWPHDKQPDIITERETNYILTW
jgi:putative sugar O-methyltransferase